VGWFQTTARLIPRPAEVRRIFGMTAVKEID